MKFLIALAMVVSSSLSFAEPADPVLFAVAHDIKSREISCDWENMLNTMSDFEANYKITNYLTAFRPNYTIDGNVINATSTDIANLVRMKTKIFLSKDQTRVNKVNFRLEYLKEIKVNNGTILNPNYGIDYVVRQTYAASCIVR